MKMYKTVGDYVASYPKETQEKLKILRSLVKKLAPKAEEMVRYGMPAYKMIGKPLVYFAAYEKHIGFYPTPSGVKAFQKDLKNYKTSKGAIQIPMTEKIPVSLATKIIKFRLKEITKK